MDTEPEETAGSVVKLAVGELGSVTLGDGTAAFAVGGIVGAGAPGTVKGAVTVG